MEIEKEKEDQIINFGAFDYDAEKIASILEVEKSVIEIEMQNKQSKLSKLLKKGKDFSDYVIDLKLFEMAQTGDIKALDKLQRRKEDRKSLF